MAPAAPFPTRQGQLRVDLGGEILGEPPASSFRAGVAQDTTISLGSNRACLFLAGTPRRQVLRCARCTVRASSIDCLSAGARRQWPNKPIDIIVPGGPGAVTDIRARWLGERLGPALGQVVVVENHPDAGGNLGTTAGAHSAPDGYKLVIVHIGTMAIDKPVITSGQISTGTASNRTCPICYGERAVPTDDPQFASARSSPARQAAMVGKHRALSMPSLRWSPRVAHTRRRTWLHQGRLGRIGPPGQQVCDRVKVMDA